MCAWRGVETTELMNTYIQNSERRFPMVESVANMYTNDLILTSPLFTLTHALTEEQIRSSSITKRGTVLETPYCYIPLLSLTQ